MREGRGRRVAFWLAEFAVLFVGWFLYVDQLQAAEAIVGVAGAALAATGAEAVRGLNFARFYPYTGWVLLIWRVPGMILDGCWVLLKVLVLRNVFGKEIQGEVKTVRFEAGGTDPRSATRRALAITYTTLAPNFIVIRIDRKEKLMLYHQVLGSEVPELTRKLGARP